MFLQADTGFHLRSRRQNAEFRFKEVIDCNDGCESEPRC